MMLDFCVKTRIRSSLRDKWLFETEVEITRVDCIQKHGVVHNYHNTFHFFLFRNVTAYLCGHLHTLAGLVPNMYARHKNGLLELELGDWRDNRR